MCSDWTVVNNFVRACFYDSLRVNSHIFVCGKPAAEFLLSNLWELLIFFHVILNWFSSLFDYDSIWASWYWFVITSITFFFVRLFFVTFMLAKFLYTHNFLLIIGWDTKSRSDEPILRNAWITCQRNDDSNGAPRVCPQG